MFPAMMIMDLPSETVIKPQLNDFIYKKKKKSSQEGWRDGSVVKSTDCSSRGPEFNSQQLKWGRNLEAGADAESVE